MERLGGMPCECDEMHSDRVLMASSLTLGSDSDCVHQGSCSYSHEFKLFSIVKGRFYIPKKYRRIELRMQGGFPQKIYFSKIA
jgi:hypothetical protein